MSAERGLGDWTKQKNTRFSASSRIPCISCTLLSSVSHSVALNVQSGCWISSEYCGSRRYMQSQISVGGCRSDSFRPIYCSEVDVSGACCNDPSRKKAENEGGDV